MYNMLQPLNKQSWWCHKKWKHFPHYWSFVRGIHWSSVNSPHNGQWRGALMISLICVWINSWVNNREAGYLRCYRAHYDVVVMVWQSLRSHQVISFFVISGWVGILTAIAPHVISLALLCWMQHHLILDCVEAGPGYTKRLIQGYHAKRVLSAMRKHGG